MKNILKNISMVVLTAFAATGTLPAQTPQTDYFIESSYMRNRLNPALRPDRGYIGIPLVSGISAGLKTNTFNMETLTEVNADGNRITFMHPDVDAKKFLSKVADDNYLASDMSLDILSFGWYKGSTFWNVNLSLRNHVDVNLPKSIFELLKQGFDQDQPTTFDLQNISATGNSFVELGLLWSRSFLNNSLTVGTRAKFLGGIADFNLHADKLSITADGNEWRTRSHVTLNASAPGIEPKYNDEENLDGFEFGDVTGLTGKGFGLDLGAAYDFSGLTLPVLKNMRVSASVTDIGRISWAERNSIRMESPETEVVITPGDYTIPTDGSSSLEDIFEEVTDDLNRAVSLQEVPGGRIARTSSLGTTIHAGLEYVFLHDKLSAGLLYSRRFGNYFDVEEITVSGNFRPMKWLAASLSYSFEHSNFDTFGGALYITPGIGLNLFVAGDYLIQHVSPQYIPTTSKALNLQLGISIPL